MKLTINCIGGDRTTAFAAAELAGYLHKMDNTLIISVENEADLIESGINLGLGSQFDSLLPEVEDKRYDDAVHINVDSGNGVICGTNPRSVLIGVYRFLRELGCRFIRPGKDNEIIPNLDVPTAHVRLTEAASYRYRENCIEGVVSYEHLSDMIDWLPKIGMNGYYMQFIKPYGFFRAWYGNKQYPHKINMHKTDEELDRIIDKIEDEIEERGLIYSKVGHSWATQSIGVDTCYWNISDIPPSEKIRPYLALVDGKRDWFGGMPLCTNLCYSNPEVNEMLSDFVVDYAKKNPHVKNVVFWPADASNNSCQCEECRKEKKTDFYVRLINLIDKKLDAAGLDTGLSFLCNYGEVPDEKLNDSKRIIMMFAPIYRNLCDKYPERFDEIRSIEEIGVKDENGNFNGAPLRDMNNTLSMLKHWQDKFRGNSVIFDYQLIWFYNMDPGNMICAENIANDMRNLKTLGLHGMSSCQSQRVFWPTALPMVAMAETLWNRETDYVKLRDSYLTDAFGEDGIKLGELLTKLGSRRLSSFMCSNEALEWDKIAGEETVAELNAVYPVIDELAALIEKNTENEGMAEPVRRSWIYLRSYPEYVRKYIDVWMSAFGEADIQKTRHRAIELMKFVMSREDEIHRVFDEVLLYRRIEYFFNTRRLPGTVLNLNT